MKKETKTMKKETKINEGTSNFYNKNASHVYAVEIEDEWDYDNLLINLQGELESEFKSDFVAKKDPINNNSYPGINIGHVTKYFDDDNYHTNIDIIVRSGYYTGANLDWELSYGTSTDSYDNIEDIAKEIKYELENEYEENIEDYSQDVVGAMDHLDNILGDTSVKKNKTTQEALDERVDGIVNQIKDGAYDLVTDVEKVFKTVSTAYDVTARFSNGEVFYSKVSEGIVVIENKLCKLAGIKNTKSLKIK